MKCLKCHCGKEATHFIFEPLCYEHYLITLANYEVIERYYEKLGEIGKC